MFKGVAAAKNVGWVNEGSSPPEALHIIALTTNETLNTELGIKPTVEYFHGLVWVWLCQGDIRLSVRHSQVQCCS